MITCIKLPVKCLSKGKAYDPEPIKINITWNPWLA